MTAEIAARIGKACFDDLDAPVERVGMAEVPLPYAKNLELAAMPGDGADRRGGALGAQPLIPACLSSSCSSSCAASSISLWRHSAAR